MKVQFICTSPVETDGWLLGAHRFETAFTVGNVLLVANAPTGGDVEFELHEDEVATGVTITLASGLTVASLTSVHVVPVGVVAQWRCIDAPADPSTSTSNVSLVMGQG